MAALTPKQTVKVGPEFYVYIAEEADVAGGATPKVTFDSATHLVTDTSVEGDWDLIAFSRTPISFSEPETVSDVYDHFGISHTKKGRQQRKTLSLKRAYTNMGESFRQYLGKSLMIMLEVKPDDDTATERLYFRSVRILTPSWDIADEEGTESIECVYAESGYKDLATT